MNKIQQQYKKKKFLAGAVVEDNTIWYEFADTSYGLEYNNDGHERVDNTSVRCHLNNDGGYGKGAPFWETGSRVKCKLPAYDASGVNIGYIVIGKTYSADYWNNHYYSFWRETNSGSHKIGHGENSLVISEVLNPSDGSSTNDIEDFELRKTSSGCEYYRRGNLYYTSLFNISTPTATNTRGEMRIGFRYARTAYVATDCYYACPSVDWINNFINNETWVNYTDAGTMTMYNDTLYTPVDPATKAEDHFEHQADPSTTSFQFFLSDKKHSDLKAFQFRCEHNKAYHIGSYHGLGFSTANNTNWGGSALKYRAIVDEDSYQIRNYDAGTYVQLGLPAETEDQASERWFMLVHDPDTSKWKLFINKYLYWEYDDSALGDTDRPSIWFGRTDNYYPLGYREIYDMKAVLSS